MKRKAVKVLLIISAAVLLLLGVLFAVALSDINGALGSDEEIPITVGEGETFRDVIDDLRDKGVIINGNLFRIYLKINGINPSVSFGEYTVKPSMSYSQILDALSGYSYKSYINVRIPSKVTLVEIADILEENNICKKSDFLAAAKGNEYTFALGNKIESDYRITYKLEGFIYPDTYSFYENDDPVRVLNVMLENTDKQVTDEMLIRADELGLSINELFAFASMVESEACGLADEMPKVAAVFWNRLNDWGENAYLQSDPTCAYPYNTQYYDTYKKGGLPAGAICNVTATALNAVLYPDETVGDYYFVSDVNKKFYYNKTNEAHESTIATLKRNGLWQ